MTAVRDELRVRGEFTASAVAARAGCSEATFYSHFGSKDDALAAAFVQTLDDLVDQSIAGLTPDRVAADGLPATVVRFVDQQADFFGVESLVFRAALSRLPSHRPLRDAYRAAEERTLEHLEALFTELDRRGILTVDAPARLAESFLVASQGINNPRALRRNATDIRRSLAIALTAMLVEPGGCHD